MKLRPPSSLIQTKGVTAPLLHFGHLPQVGFSLPDRRQLLTLCILNSQASYEMGITTGFRRSNSPRRSLLLITTMSLTYLNPSSLPSKGGVRNGVFFVTPQKPIQHTRILAQ